MWESAEEAGYIIDSDPQVQLPDIWAAVGLARERWLARSG